MDTNLVFFTDRYQLTMLAAYARHGLASRRAVFELFVRRLPPTRRFMVSCGLGRILPALAGLRFDEEHLARLEADPVLGPAFGDPAVRSAFESFRFQGRVWGIPEGRICFPGEPLLRVEGNLFEAQLIETLLLSVVNHDVRVASKCARIVSAADGRDCFEFGSRRVHERAAVDAARAAWVAGFSGTSNEEAGRRYGIPVFGTMAHAYVLAHTPDEGEAAERRAFADFANTFSQKTTALIDTYDVLRGAEYAIEGCAERLGAVRIDSGDLGSAASSVRRLLDARGHHGTRIVVSNDVDEYQIEALVRSGAPVDSFGVGTMAVCTPDAPALGAVYKLVAIEDRDGTMTAVQKRSPGKGGTAAPKQVLRRDGAIEDVLVLDGERREGWSELLEPMFDPGRPVVEPTPEAAALELATARQRLATDLGHAGRDLRSLAPREAHEEHPVTRSEALRALQAEVETHGSFGLTTR